MDASKDIPALHGNSHETSAAFERTAQPLKKPYPGHGKLMQDLKSTKNKLEKLKKEFLSDPAAQQVREQLEALRLDEEPENTRLMRIKYEEKQSEKQFVQEQKDVEDRLVEFNLKNKEHLQETRDNYEKIKMNHNQVIVSYQKLRQKETEDILRLKKDHAEAEREKEKLDRDLKEKLTAKEFQERRLSRLSVYEHFLFRVMKAAEEHEKDDKPKDAIKKMIDRYERLKKKQKDLKNQTLLKETEKKKKLEELVKIRREMQSENFKMNSLINSTNRDIEELQKTLKNIDLEISEKVRLNQDKMIESAKLEMAVNNLHSMLVNNRKEMREAGLVGPAPKPPSKGKAAKVEEAQSLTETILKKLEDIGDKMAELKHYITAYRRAEYQT